MFRTQPALGSLFVALLPALRSLLITTDWGLACICAKRWLIVGVIFWRWILLWTTVWLVIVLVVRSCRYDPRAKHEIIECLFSHIFKFSTVWNGSVSLTTAIIQSSLVDWVFSKLHSNVFAALTPTQTIVREWTHPILISVSIRACHLSRCACFSICVT